MAKKSKDGEARGGAAGVARADVPAPAAKPEKAGKFVTGYDYSHWGPEHNAGARPPAKADWDAMSPEQRASIGLPDWNSYKSAAQAWRGRFKEGGDIYAGRLDLARGLAQSGARDWGGIERYL